MINGVNIKGLTAHIAADKTSLVTSYNVTLISRGGLQTHRQKVWSVHLGCSPDYVSFHFSYEERSAIN